MINLSRLMLGTAQFGLPYGIANRTGQPSYETIKEILAVAWEGGVNCVDTAAGYGESEVLLGKAMHELGIAQKLTVVSKICPLADGLDGTAADRLVEESVLLSLKRLRIDVLPICLFHREENGCYLESLLKLKNKGLVKYGGASAMTPQGSRRLVSDKAVKAMQIPMNLVDHRFWRSGVIKEAGRNEIFLFTRSVYLQGLILMPDKDILPELAEVLPVLSRLRSIAADSGLTLAALAMRYVLSFPEITSVLAGVETVVQIRENLRLISMGPLETSIVTAVNAAVPDLSDHVLMPNLWSKRMPDIQPLRAEKESR